MSQCANFAFKIAPSFKVKVCGAVQLRATAGKVCLQVTAQTAPGTITLPAFSLLYQQFLDALPRCKSVEVAIAAPYLLTAGEPFVWANDTDVGIAGDLTTVPIP